MPGADMFVTDPVRLREAVKKAVDKYTKSPYVKVGVSNRHIHISREDLDELFGKGRALTPRKELLPGQFACDETVTIIGRKNRLERVRILGPVRKATQVEISLTDAFTLGVRAPVNESGNLTGAASVIIENPDNGARIKRACAIAALRHVHLSLEFAAKYGLRDGQLVSLAFEGPRALTFGGVLVRVSGDFTDEIHLDTDEANAGRIGNGDFGKIII
ncbi:MAG: phosphate propanoyltransferase [Synergistaceae bacterium]|jgi:putative phosphotransacetylase|nr:phosphate propanoyltransferase [Synergistaceae bacterium]